MCFFILLMNLFDYQGIDKVFLLNYIFCLHILSKRSASNTLFIQLRFLVPPYYKFEILASQFFKSLTFFLFVKFE